MQDKYTKSKRADQDIHQIVLHSMKEFGEPQTDKYLSGLSGALKMLSDNPDIGNPFFHALTGSEYRRYVYASHVIYYRRRLHDIFIVRILHSRMVPEGHL